MIQRCVVYDIPVICHYSILVGGGGIRRALMQFYCRRCMPFLPASMTCYYHYFAHGARGMPVLCADDSPLLLLLLLLFLLFFTLYSIILFPDHYLLMIFLFGHWWPEILFLLPYDVCIIYMYYVLFYTYSIYSIYSMVWYCVVLGIIQWYYCYIIGMVLLTVVTSDINWWYY